MLGHLLEPDEPSKEDLWLEQELEERITSIQVSLDNLAGLPKWFQEVVDWVEVEERLSKELAQQLEEIKAEAEIAAWENGQAARDAECYGW